MSHQILSILFLFSRYMHVIGACLLVGGTLFYELIVPVAIDDLKDEQKLAVFARARWAFRWIVWLSMFLMITSGIVSTYRNWYAYNGQEAALSSSPNHAQPPDETIQLRGVGYWWLGHAVAAIIGLGVALALVMGGTPPRYPLVWMRVNLLILMLAIFLASATRHMRLRLIEVHLPPAESRNTVD